MDEICRCWGSGANSGGNRWSSSQRGRSVPNILSHRYFANSSTLIFSTKIAEPSKQQLTIFDISLLESFGQTWQSAKVWSVLAIHLKKFTSGESETERLGGGVHLEQSHQLPPQPAWCWEVDSHQQQIQNTGFEIQIHNLHAAEIAWHHKYKIPNIRQVQIYNFPTSDGLTSTGRVLSRAHPPDFLLGFSLSRLPTGAVRGAHAFSFFTPTWAKRYLWFSFKSLHVSNVSLKSIIYMGDSRSTYAVDVDIRCTARNGKFLVRLISVNQMATKML